MSPTESHEPFPAMPDSSAWPARSRLWTRLWDGIFPLLLFPLVTLALYWPAMQDVPRGDHVILWEIYRRQDWSWSGLDEILFVSFLDKPRFQPLMFFLHFLQATLFGQTFWLYHLVNVILHGLNAFLLFRIARALDQDWLPSLVVALLFLTAFTHIDLVAWSFHYYILLQATLGLFAVYLLIRRDRISWSLVWAYAAALIQIYLYEPGVVLPVLLFAIDALRQFRRPGWVLRLSASLLLAAAATAIYLATYVAFFTAMQVGTGVEDPRALIDFPSLLRAVASPVPLLLDTALLHNLFSTPKFIVDELFFLAPPRIDRFTFAQSITNALVIGCCGLVALTFLAILSRRDDSQTEPLPEGESQDGEPPSAEPIVNAADERRPRIYAAATLATGLIGFGFVFATLSWSAGPSLFQALFVIWLPVGLLAGLALRSPARARALARRIADRWPARLDPLYLGLAVLLALALLFLAPRGDVAALANDATRLPLEPWDFAAILLALAIILMGERPRGRRLVWTVFVLAGVVAYFGIIGLGRPVVYLISQSRYGYLPTLALAILALIVFAPVLARRPAEDRRWLSLLSLRKHVILAGLILFLSLNAVKVVGALEEIMAYRAETNRMVYGTRRFLDDRVQSGDRLFLARSSYPDHERLAWGSDILPQILFAGDGRVTQNLQTATHVLGDDGRATPVPGALLDAGAESFVLRFGFIAVVRQAGAATLEIFTPPGGCAAGGWYLDFAFDESQPTLAGDQLGFGRLAFGRCDESGKTLLFESDPVMVDFNRLNLFEFGRSKDRYYLIHNGVLAKTAPASDPIDLNAMAFELGEAYETRVKVYLSHTFIALGMAPRDLEEAEIGDRFPEPPYHPFGFRTYARTLI